MLNCRHLLLVNWDHTLQAALGNGQAVLSNANAQISKILSELVFGAGLKEIGAPVSRTMSAAVFPRRFLRSTLAPEAKRRDAQSNLAVMMLNIRGVAPEWW